MQLSELLPTTIDAFEHWRSTKTSVSAPTPKTLRQKAVALLEHYSSTQVHAALRISSSQLKQWRKELSPQESAAKASDVSNHFIELPATASNHSDPIKLELCFSNGDKLHLSGIEPQMVSSIIGAMKS